MDVLGSLVFCSFRSMKAEEKRTLIMRASDSVGSMA
jgi:hypothetical protein